MRLALACFLALALGALAFYALAVVVCLLAIAAPFIVFGCLAYAVGDGVVRPWIGRRHGGVSRET